MKRGHRRWHIKKQTYPVKFAKPVGVHLIGEKNGRVFGMRLTIVHKDAETNADYQKKIETEWGKIGKLILPTYCLFVCDALD